MWPRLLVALLGLAVVAAWTAVDVFAAAGPSAGRAAVLLLTVLPLVVTARQLRTRGALPIAAIAVAVIAVLAALPWHPRKKFARDLFSITPGMPTAAAIERMHGWIQGPGAKWQPLGASGDAALATGEGVLIWRWNERDPAYDSDFGMVTIAGGRVAAVEFLPD